MLRYLFAYLAGAATVTAFVLATGGTNLTLFALGVLAAVAVFCLACRALGAARLVRWLGGVPKDPPRKQARQRALKRPTACPTVGQVGRAVVGQVGQLEQEVASALTNLGVGAKVAAACARAAAGRAAHEFEPMFKVAVDLAAGKKAA